MIVHHFSWNDCQFPKDGNSKLLFFHLCWYLVEGVVCGCFNAAGTVLSDHQEAFDIRRTLRPKSNLIRVDDTYLYCSAVRYLLLLTIDQRSMIRGSFVLSRSVIRRRAFIETKIDLCAGFGGISGFPTIETFCRWVRLAKWRSSGLQ